MYVCTTSSTIYGNNGVDWPIGHIVKYAPLKWPSSPSAIIGNLRFFASVADVILALIDRESIRL